MNNPLAKWLAWRLPPAVLLWAVVRAFAYYGDNGDHNYSEVYKMLKDRFGIKDN